MDIIIFTHPTFLGSESMPRYAQMLQKGMLEQGHSVRFWTAKPFFYRIPSPRSAKKWLGYIDQFILFPIIVKFQLLFCNSKTLFVFADQALGPWVPLVKKRKHIIHCHDFLAQKSAFGTFPENRVGTSGKLYQAFIRRGYKKGSNFISISQKTQNDLHHFLGRIPKVSEIVYNGLNQTFLPTKNITDVRNEQSTLLNIDLSKGYILHVGGNKFYKNRKGVIELYDAWSKTIDNPIPLILIGSEPTQALIELKKKSAKAKHIHFCTKVADTTVQKAYQGASVFLFPSLAEGFGWPIAEAMASGCPVITTNEAPMTEVSGNAAYFITKRPSNESDLKAWLQESIIVLDKVVALSIEERQTIIDLGLENAKRFDTKKALSHIEEIYSKI